jgi:hypothetical protein
MVRPLDLTDLAAAMVHPSPRPLLESVLMHASSMLLPDSWNTNNLGTPEAALPMWWWPEFKKTPIAASMLASLTGGPHEGLCLTRRASRFVVQKMHHFPNAYATPLPMEEFVLQSLSVETGEPFAQLCNQREVQPNALDQLQNEFYPCVKVYAAWQPPWWQRPPVFVVVVVVCVLIYLLWRIE